MRLLIDYKPIIKSSRVLGYEPLVYMTLFGPADHITKECKLDTGACRTVLSSSDAAACGIDLTGSPKTTLTAANGTKFDAHVARVSVAIGNDNVKYTMDTEIAFSDTSLKRPLIGHRGFLQFFNVCFYGERLYVVMSHNVSFPGDAIDRSAR